MKPLPFVWPFALFFWAVWVWAYIPEFRIMRRARLAERTKLPGLRDPSYRPLIMGQQIIIFVAVLLAFRLPGFAMNHFRFAVFLLGVLVAISGSLLRRHCFRMLGSDFRGDVTVRSDQTVVERGAYRYLRHPSYSAAMLLHLGFGLALGNWASLALLLLGILPLFIYRITVEERALLKTLGPAYGAYMARTRRMLPGVW